MKRTPPSRNRLLAPLLYLAAALLLLEEWFWDAGMRISGAIQAWPPLLALEQRVARLRPYPALCVFVVPGLLLVPVKVLAVVAIAHGHAASGIATIVVAKLLGAAVVARVYVLTLPTLKRLAWFARAHRWFLATRDRLVGRLRATHAYHRTRHLVVGLRLSARRLLRRLGASISSGSRHASHTARFLRRFCALWRARRRSTRTDRR
jgi:hypothetical protein